MVLLLPITFVICPVCSCHPCDHLLGKGWPLLSCVLFLSLSHMVFQVKCGTWLYRFLFFPLPLLQDSSLKDSHIHSHKIPRPWSVTLTLHSLVISSAHQLTKRKIWVKLNEIHPNGSEDMERTQNLKVFVIQQLRNLGLRFGTSWMHLGPRWLGLLSVLGRWFCCFWIFVYCYSHCGSL